MTAPVGGAPAPELPGTAGPRVLRPLRSDRLLVVFYQEDGTPACTTALCSFKEDAGLLDELGVELVGVSVDDLEAHRAFIDRVGGLPFPLLSDLDGEVARAFGVWDPESRRSRRAVFLLDGQGAILHQQVPYTPANVAQYEAVFRALGLSI